MKDLWPEYDAYMVEAHGDMLEQDIVTISPYNTKTGEWLCGMMEITTFESAKNRGKTLVSKDKETQRYLEAKYET